MTTSDTRRTRRSFFTLAATLALGLAGVLGLGSAMGMGPEPDPIPRKWELTVDPGELRYASVDANDGEGAKGYFYLTYKVTNTSGKDMLFTPSFDLCNDKGEVLRSGRDVPAAVTRALLEKLDNKFLEDQISIVGMLLKGESNAKEGLVVWPASTLHMAQLDIYGSGFSGETKSVEMQDAKTGKPTKITLRKTLKLSYQPTGDIRDQGSKPFEMIEKRWVMR
jgi:hypothetical protein